MEPSAEPVIETQPASSRFAGFWRRIGALCIDSAVLGLIGFPLGLLLGERYAPAGTPARLIGLLVVVPYLSVMGSRVAGGQTLGKRLLGLRVVDATGQPLSEDRAFVRAALLSLPWIFNGIRFGSLGPVVLATMWVAGVLVFGVGGAIVGTYVLNRRTRQALHDLVVGSYVIEASGLGLPVPATSTRRPAIGSAVWIWIVAAAVTALVAMASTLVGGRFPVLLETVESIPGASSLEITSHTSWQIGLRSGERTSKALVAVLWFRGSADGTRQAAREVAAAMLQHHPDAATAPTLAVTVIRGWDIGIASSTSAVNFAQTPAQWRAELGM
jgi:uncharacterized RDD family membrane protein YckC